MNQLKDIPPCTSEQELIERYGAIAFDKQLDFAELVGGKNWNADIGKGEITFGGELHFPIQILGTFSHGSQNWLWAWANTQSGLPDQLLEQAVELKQYGETNGIDLLSTSTFDFSKAQMHFIGLIALEMFQARGYYIADFGKGALLVTIPADHRKQTLPENQLRIFSAFPQFISQFEMNQQRAFVNYLQAKGYVVLQTDGIVSGTRNDNRVTAKFDGEGRLLNLEG
jgi:hypothetical protein